MCLKRIVLLCALVILLGGSGQAQEAAAIRICVLSYNIHHGEGIDAQINLERIASVISSVDPDIVALQEVDQRTRRTKFVDQPAVLAELTSMQVVFGHNIPYQGGLYGNAVLSRLPIVHSENHPLPVFYKGEQRGVLEVELALNDDSLLLFATHLDYRRRSKERIASARMINGLIAKRTDAPALLIGDLNDVSCSCPLRILGKRWQRTNRRVLPTYPVRCPYKQIDYVMFRPRDRWRVIETRVLSECVASDHRPILAVLELREPKLPAASWQNAMHMSHPKQGTPPTTATHHSGVPISTGETPTTRSSSASRV